MKLRQLTLALLSALTLTVSAANTKTTVGQVTGTIDLTTNVDYVITGTTPFTTAGCVNIVNTEHAALIIQKIKPSLVLKNWMSYIRINGEAAVDGTNCQVKMYGTGAIILPYASDIAPLTCYTEQDFGGEACANYSEGSSGGFMKSLYTNTLNNKIRSFKLKRGYMVTFAIGSAGWGYSRCFIAHDEDLEMATLPAILDQKISSYRIFKWHYAQKKGLASNGSKDANAALNTSWCYDWAQGNASNLPDTEWVPNHIYEDYPSPATCGGVTGSCHMKTNNEPRNSADDHPQELPTILGNWENLMRTGMRLCSPSSWDGSDYWNGTGFIKQFLDSIDARGWRCDIVDAHCYWPEGNFGHLASSWYTNMKRPIWVSEWVWGASWNNNGAFASGVTESQNATVVQRICENMNSMDCVERYAYWNSERDPSRIYKNNSLTATGQYYANMDAGIGYKPSLQFIPRETRLSGPTGFTCTYNRNKATVALEWADPNAELSTTINVQCKQPGSNIFSTIATMTPKDKNSSAGVSYNYTDTVADPGVYVYRVQVKTYNNKTFTSEESTVNVAPAQGTSKFQYGKLQLDNFDENKIYYSETFESSPYVFMGPTSYNNSTLQAGNRTAKNYSKTYFTYQLMPWSTNTATMSKTEEVPFIALEPGSHTFGDMSCEVALVMSKTASGGNTCSDVTEVTFAKPFPEGVTPVVLTEIIAPSYATGTTTTTLCCRTFDVTNTGFKFIIYSEYASQRAVGTAQKVAYMAITPGFANVDEKSGIVIAAGHGTESQLYGVGTRENFFNVPTTDENGDATTTQLRLASPTIFAATQSNNYPSAIMLRRTNSTVNDENGKTWTTGIKVKRVPDHNLTIDGKTIKTTATDLAYRDDMSWVAVAKAVEGGSLPTAIGTISAGDSQAGTLRARVIDGRIYVDGAASFEVFSTSGTQVSSNSPLAPGIYVVKANGKSTKILVK